MTGLTAMEWKVDRYMAMCDYFFKFYGVLKRLSCGEIDAYMPIFAVCKIRVGERC